MGQSGTATGALDHSASQPVPGNREASQGQAPSLDEQARGSMNVQKSNQVIDEILAEAENMDGVEDQSGELETIK